jgi:hypothetical protein
MDLISRYRIITPDMVGGSDGSNINGPCCIELPTSVENRLGNYYLYFAHHHGSYIRMAYADELTGPWTIHSGGVLSLSDLAGCVDHIASPDVVVDPKTGEIRMYFHGVDQESRKQLTFVAQSADGLSFTASPRPIANSYLRVASWRGNWVGMSKGALIYLSIEGLGDFAQLPRPALPLHSPDGNAPGDTRHVALLAEKDRLWVAFTRIGDAPEHIRFGHVDLLMPMDRWRLEAHAPLLMPELDWEGATIAVAPGRAGAAVVPENALRDPFLLRSGEDVWLFYSFAGEQGIGLARLPALERCYRGTRQEIAWPAGATHGADDADAAALRQLEAPRALEQRLADLDATKPTNRIFLMGCGRSGTWLLTTLMSCFDDTEVVASELPVEAFGLRETDSANLVIKRRWDSYTRVDAIPDAIHILYIMRHPFDVLTSHNPMTGKKYHVSPHRWLGELAALRRLLDSGRERLLIVTYEELVREPDSTTKKIAESFDLAVRKLPSQAMATADLPPEAISAMRGLRPISSASVARYLNEPDSVEFLKKAVPILREELDWVARYFGFDLSLP